MAGAGARRRARRRDAAALLAGRGLRAMAAALGRTGAGRQAAFRRTAGAGARAHLVQLLPAGAHRSGPARGLRVRRRGRTGGLCASDRRCCRAGADCQPGAAAVGSRNHTRTGAAVRREPVPVVDGGGALPSVAGPARRAAVADADGRQRRAGGGRDPGDGRHAGAGAFDLRARPPPRAMVRGRRGGRGAAGLGAGHLGLAHRCILRCGVDAVHRPRMVVVHVAGLAAGAVDALALAAPPAEPACVGTAGDGAGGAGGQPADGRRRAHLAARPARPGRAGRLCAAHAEPQHRRPSTGSR